jgi:hypothetical protein
LHRQYLRLAERTSIANSTMLHILVHSWLKPIGLSLSNDTTTEKRCDFRRHCALPSSWLGGAPASQARAPKLFGFSAGKRRQLTAGKGIQLNLQSVSKTAISFFRAPVTSPCSTEPIRAFAERELGIWMHT